MVKWKRGRMGLSGNSGEGDSRSQFAAMNGSKIRTWRLLIRVCAGGKRTSVLVLSSPALLGREWYVLFRLGEVREGTGVRSEALFTSVSSPFLNLLALKHSEFSKRLFQRRCEALHRKHAFSQVDQKVCDLLVSGDHASCTSMKSWPGFRNQLSLCEALLKLKGTIWQRWHQNFLFNMKKNSDEEKFWQRKLYQTLTWIT